LFPASISETLYSLATLAPSVSLPLIRDALEFLNDHGQYLISIYERMWGCGEEVGTSKKKGILKKAKVAAEFEAEKGFAHLREKLHMPNSEPRHVINVATRMADGAAITIILFLVGVRVRELTSLDAGCVSEQTDTNANIEYVLDGVAGKSNGRRRSWAITSPVKDAIQYLESAHKSSRIFWGESALFVQAAHGRSLPGKRWSIKRIAPALISNRLRFFARAAFREPIPVSVRIHPHSARKTFAHFVVMRDKNSLESLAHHFGHIHRSITDASYIGTDIELEKLLNEESRKDLAQGLSDILRSKQIGGKGAKQFSELRHSVSNDERFRGKKALVQLVDRLIQSGIQLAPCDWGYCLYSQATSACHGTRSQPNELRRTAQTCSTCLNFAVTERHRKWWETRYDRDQSFLTNGLNLPEQTIRFVSDRNRETLKVLEDLNRQRTENSNTVE
jgi:integrase